MTNVKGISPVSVTPAPSSSSSGAVTQLRPRPALPKQRLTVRPIAHDLAWGPDDDKPAIPRVPGQRQPADRILTAPGREQGHATRAQVRAALGDGIPSAMVAFGEPDGAA